MLRFPDMLEHAVDPARIKDPVPAWNIHNISHDQGTSAPAIPTPFCRTCKKGFTGVYPEYLTVCRKTGSQGDDIVSCPAPCIKHPPRGFICNNPVTFFFYIPEKRNPCDQVQATAACCGIPRAIDITETSCKRLPDVPPGFPGQ
jgi:hypothetical protein